MLNPARSSGTAYFSRYQVDAHTGIYDRERLEDRRQRHGNSGCGEPRSLPMRKDGQGTIRSLDSHPCVTTTSTRKSTAVLASVAEPTVCKGAGGIDFLVDSAGISPETSR